MDYFLLSFGCIGFAATLGLLRTKQLVYAGLCFLIALISLAAIFILQDAAFVGVAQIVVYIGGILVLMLFGMMFIGAGSNQMLELRPKLRFLPIALVSIITFGLVRETLKLDLSSTPKADKLTAESLGIELVMEQVVNFELIAVLLLVALVGSLFIGSRKS
ncbi:MAG: NADH-quinone oxidoreductase subunit J [Bacteroidota bacterium]